MKPLLRFIWGLMLFAGGCVLLYHARYDANTDWLDWAIAVILLVVAIDHIEAAVKPDPP